MTIFICDKPNYIRSSNAKQNHNSSLMSNREMSFFHERADRNIHNKQAEQNNKSVMDLLVFEMLIIMVIMVIMSTFIMVIIYLLFYCRIDLCLDSLDCLIYVC